MYGMGGSFGGMNYQSPGHSLVSGIEAGQSIVLRAQEAIDRRQQMMDERNRQDRLDQMHQAQVAFANKHVEDEEQRQHLLGALTAAKAQREAFSDYGKSLFQQYGSWDKVPQELKDHMGEQRDQFNQRWDMIMNGLYGNVQADGNAAAKKTGADLQKGTVDPNDPQTPGRIHQMITASTGLNPIHFLPGEDGQSVVGKSLANYNAGMQSGDRDQMLDGASGILHNQVNTHLGELDETGATVTGRRIAGVVPTPDGKGMYPVVAVDGQHTDGSTTTAPTQPIRTNGFAHSGNQQLVSFSPDTLHDHLGQIGMINAAATNSPQLQQMIADSAKNPPQESLDHAQAVTGQGMSPNPKSAMFGTDADGSTWGMHVGADGTPMPQTKVVMQPPPANAARDAETAAFFDFGGKAREQNAEEIKANAARSLVGKTNPATNQPYTEDDINRHIAGMDAPSKEPTEAALKQQAGQRLIGTMNPENNQPYTQADIDRQMMGMNPKAPAINIDEGFIKDAKSRALADLGLSRNADTNLIVGADGKSAPDWRDLKRAQASESYIESATRMAQSQKKPLDWDQLLTIAKQQGDLAVHGLPDLQAGKKYEWDDPAPDDPNTTVHYKARYQGGDPSNPKNYTEFLGVPTSSSRPVPPTGTPVTAPKLGGIGAATMSPGQETPPQQSIQATQAAGLAETADAGRD